MRTSNATDVAATQLNQLQRAYNLLERDFFQLQARAPRNEPDVFVQHDDALELTTLNGVSGQVQLERVRWRRGQKLWRDIWPVIDSPADVKPEEVPILSDVKEMTWRFWKEGWQNKWTDTAHQPDGVELLLTMENGDTGAGYLPRRVIWSPRRHQQNKRLRHRGCGHTSAATTAAGARSVRREQMSGKSVRKQRGVALLVVLILLVMMSALATKISQQFCRNLQKTRYQVSQQLRWAIQSQQNH